MYSQTSHIKRNWWKSVVLQESSNRVCLMLQVIFFCFSFIAIRMNLELLLAMSGGWRAAPGYAPVATSTEQQYKKGKKKTNHQPFRHWRKSRERLIFGPVFYNHPITPPAGTSPLKQLSKAASFILTRSQELSISQTIHRNQHFIPVG